MVTVIIPVLNESATVASVVEFAWRCPLVSEVLVVDDGSIDGTPALARAAGARVVTSTFLGKGASMEDGLLEARNEIVVYLDGDLSGLAPDLIERLTAPIRCEQAEFVKAKFSRSAGRVTVLTARPLLRTFFPELSHFDQPLGGIIAGRRSLLRRLRFENDYGVDIGILLDVAALGARIAEVDIGHIEHDSHPLEVLGDMATQVVRTLLERADRQRRFSMRHVREVQEVERRMQAELQTVLQRVGKVEKLALFDMDGVLLDGRFVECLARQIGKSEELSEFLDSPSFDPQARTHQIAELWAGVPKELIETTARNMPLIPGVCETVVGLRAAGYRVGIVTDSYHVVSEVVRRRVFADFSIAHLLKFRHGTATGKVQLSSAMQHPRGCEKHAICKLNVLTHLREKAAETQLETLAVGDGENDVCLLGAASLSVAFQPKSPAVRAAAMHVVERDSRRILELALEAGAVSTSLPASPHAPLHSPPHAASLRSDAFARNAS